MAKKFTAVLRVELEVEYTPDKAKCLELLRGITNAVLEVPEWRVSVGANGEYSIFRKLIQLESFDGEVIPAGVETIKAVESEAVYGKWHYHRHLEQKGIFKKEG